LWHWLVVAQWQISLVAHQLSAGQWSSALVSKVVFVGCTIVSWVLGFFTVQFPAESVLDAYV
jgi:hypothetical protein